MASVPTLVRTSRHRHLGHLGVPARPDDAAARPPGSLVAAHRHATHTQRHAALNCRRPGNRSHFEASPSGSSRRFSEPSAPGVHVRKPRVQASHSRNPSSLPNVTRPGPCRWSHCAGWPRMALSRHETGLSRTRDLWPVGGLPMPSPRCRATVTRAGGPTQATRASGTADQNHLRGPASAELLGADLAAHPETRKPSPRRKQRSAEG